MQANASDLDRRNDKRRRAWARRAPKYDRSIGFFERRVFGSEHRAWACAQAKGETLEVAVGTGLNLRLYDADVRLTAIDLSPEMLEIAKQRAHEIERVVDLREADAHHLPFVDASFDTVVCTYSLCNIPDPHRAVGEMKRVLRPGGQLVLVDHIRSSVKPVLWLQKLIEFFSMRIEGEHMTRRPLEQVKAHGFTVTQRERVGPGAVVERLVAVRDS
ncbi:MAG: class I SAM-dependent methyltransferase [Actinomycetota bacterium]|nr:class I SAM-dependent methyltransferase [Actinomycetota bacterium]